MYRLDISALQFVKKDAIIIRKGTLVNGSDECGGVALNYCIHNEIMRMQNYMHKHYLEPVGVEDVAKSVGYSPRRANLLFKICCGETIGDYLRTLRMEDARRSLATKTPIDRVALSLSYTPRGFRKAFQEYFGISPSQYLAGEQTCELYVKVYEYTSEGNWGNGENPTSDGLWKFFCYDPGTQELVPMEWNALQDRFQSPQYDCRSSSQWYCQNRNCGNGMHPGRATHAVKAFLCPQDGRVEIFYSVGRCVPYRRKWNRTWKSWKTPCAARLYRNGEPLGDAAVMATVDPVFLKATCSVCAGDEIRLHIDPLEDHVGDGVVLYRQRIAYLNVRE